MATVNLVSSKSSAWSGYFTYSYTQNASANYSDVSISVYAKKEDGYKSGTNSGTWDVSITVAGSTETLCSAGGYALPYSSYYCYGSDTGSSVASFRVYHENDGSVTCNVSILAYPPSGLSWSDESLKYSGTISLPTIPRSSTISSTKNVYFGEPCQITWTPPSSSFYYKLKFGLGTWSYTTAAIRPGTTSSYSYSGYTIPLEAAKQIPNAVSGKMSVSLYSYSDSSCTEQVGSTSTSSFTATLSDDIVPSISTCNISIDNSVNSVAEEWGIALAGFSRFNIVSTADGAYGSTITSFNISGGYTAVVTGSSLDYTGSIITTSGNKQFLITCTDSRGRTSEVFTSDLISVTPYSLPKVRRVTITKNTYDDADTTNDRMVVESMWEYDTVGGRNSVTAKVYYKATSSEEWTLHSGEIENETPFVLTNLVPEETSSYNFKVVVTDLLGNSSEKDAFSSTTRVLMDFQAGGRGLGIGKICEIDNEGNDTSSLEVSMDSYFFGNMYIRGAAIMVLGTGMYGTAEPMDAVSDPIKGQIYFKKVSS